MMEWKPIETAPDTGEIIVWHELFGMQQVDASHFIERGRGREYFNGDVYCPGTLWHPMPEPPK